MSESFLCRQIGVDEISTVGIGAQLRGIQGAGALFRLPLPDLGDALRQRGLGQSGGKQRRQRLTRPRAAGQGGIEEHECHVAIRARLADGRQRGVTAVDHADAEPGMGERIFQRRERGGAGDQDGRHQVTFAEAQAMSAMSEADLRAMTRMIEGDAAVAINQLQATRDRQAALTTDVLLTELKEKDGEPQLVAGAVS